MAGKKRKKRSRQFDGGTRAAAGAPLGESSVAETAARPVATSTEAPSDGDRATVQASTDRPEQSLPEQTSGEQTPAQPLAPSLALTPPHASAVDTGGDDDLDGSPDRGIVEAADGAALPDRTERRTLEMLICPLTKATLEYDEANQELISRRANVAYPIRFGVPLLTREAARSLDEERRPG